MGTLKVPSVTVATVELKFALLKCNAQVAPGAAAPFTVKLTTAR